MIKLKMPRKNFKAFFLENVSGFLWRQWSSMGAAGGALQEDDWAADPEALLVYSLGICRFEPRLFDEIIDWLVINGKFIDIQRLRAILRIKDVKTRRLVSAAAGYVSGKAGSYSRKWEALSLVEKNAPPADKEILFISKEGKPFPKPRNLSKIFLEYGFLRGEISGRSMSRPVPVNTGINIRFLLRSLFGVGSRSECLLYLLTHESGHPADIAEAAGSSSQAVKDSLIELAGSGLVRRRKIGKRKTEYRLSQNRWWEFLSGKDGLSVRPPSYINWIALFSALEHVFEALTEAGGAKSAYMKSSRIKQSMQAISDEFSASGISLPGMPGRHAKPEKFELEFQDFIVRVFGADED